MAYVEMFGRDRGRFEDARKRLNESPWARPRWLAPPFPSTATPPPHARLHPADAQFHGCDFSARLCVGISCGLLNLCRPFIAPGERAGAMVHARIWFRQTLRCLYDRLLHYAAEENNPDAAELILAEDRTGVG